MFYLSFKSCARSASGGHVQLCFRNEEPLNCISLYVNHDGRS